MGTPDKEQSWGSWLSSVRSTAFFVLYGLYVWLYVDPWLIYHSFGVSYRFPLFTTDAAFLREHLTDAGGPIECLSALLSQGYYHSWLGALIITLLAWLLWAGTRMLIRLARVPWAGFGGYVAPLLLLAMYNGGDHPLTSILALAAAIWLAVGCARLPLRHWALRTGLFIPAFVLGYWIAGGAVVLSVILVSSHECLTQRRWLSGGLSLAAGAAIPWLFGAYVFDLVLSDAYLRLSPLDAQILSWLLLPAVAVCMYVAVPAVVLVPALCRLTGLEKLFSRIARAAAKGEPRGPGRVLRHALKGKVAWAVQTTALALACFVSLSLSWNRDVRESLWLTFHARHRMWPELLDRARDLPPDFRHAGFTHEINRALYHTGRLGEEMFSFPQSPYALLLFPMKRNDPAWRPRRAGETLWDLGDVNGSEWQTFEALEVGGDCPVALEKLALINITKGQAETARVFLAALRKDLVYGARAEEILRRLDEDPALAGDPDIRRLRRQMPVQDHVLPWDDPNEPLLSNLLGRCPFNRMAYEYLMAYYLLTRQLQKFVEKLELLDNFGYGREMPTHYEEAVLLYSGGVDPALDLHGRRIRPETVKRFQEFGTVLRRFWGDRKEARRRLAPEFGRSYYFYWAFGESGVRQ